MTNAFATRHQNQDKIKDLRRSIQHVLDQMSDLRLVSETNYQEYLCQLKRILPRKEEFSLAAEVIAARLSNDEDEQQSICASLRGLAQSARNKRMGSEDFSSMPALKTSMRTTTRHFAELDDEDNPIRKWDVEKLTITYYLDQKG